MAKIEFRSPECGHTREIAHGASRPSFCPQGKGVNLLRAEEDGGCAHGGGRRIGRGGSGGPPIKRNHENADRT